MYYYIYNKYRLNVTRHLKRYMRAEVYINIKDRDK